MVRPPCCDKMNVKRGLWTPEEDSNMQATGSWTDVSKRAGPRRCGKSCRLRWGSYIRPKPGRDEHDSFTPQEEEMIIRLHATIGSRWSIIAQQLPGRLDIDVKTHWNTKLRKKLTEMGIDPVTHKPFSQILADYGNIGGLPQSGARVGAITRDLKNAFTFKSQQSPIQPQEFLKTIGPNQENLLSLNHRSSSSSSNCSTKLPDLCDLTKASKQGTTPTQFLTHGYASSAASSSSSNGDQGSFNWRDFLLEDAFPGANMHGQESLMEFSPKGNDSSSQMHEERKEEKNDFAAVEEMMNCSFPINSFKTSSPSSDSSFVEAMLDQQNDVLLQLPTLLEETFFY